MNSTIRRRRMCDQPSNYQSQSFSKGLFLWSMPKLAMLLVACALAVVATGCSQKREIVEYPPGALKVRFTPAADYTDCLVASTVMCSNYLRGHNLFTSKQVRSELAASDLDHTRVGGIRQWLTRHHMRMVPIQGELSNLPPRGLAWWILSRGHPVICVVNKHGDDADYNHAVVVIGVKMDEGDAITGLHVLDPASQEQLEFWPTEEFERYWTKTDHVMLPMFDAPAQTARSTIANDRREL